MRVIRRVTKVIKLVIFGAVALVIALSLERA